MRDKQRIKEPMSYSGTESVCKAMNNQDFSRLNGDMSLAFW